MQKLGILKINNKNINIKDIGKGFLSIPLLNWI